MKTKTKRNSLIFIIFFLISICIVLLLVIGIMKYESMPHFSTADKGGYIHFSVDDSNSLFEDLTIHQEEYDSIFDNSTLNYMRALHEQYGLKVSFYVFYSWDVSNDSFSLADATDKFATEFQDNSDWLRFGFHAKDAAAYESITASEETDYYEKTINELIRITGSSDCIDNFVRLDRFYATEDMVNQLTGLDDGVVGFLCADSDDRESYDLTEDERRKLYNEDWIVKNGIEYTPTDIRIENITDNKDFYSDLDLASDEEVITVFTHEWKLEDEKVQKYIKWFAEYAEQSDREFVFLEDFDEN